MKLARLFLAIGSLAFLGITVTSPAKADSFDKKTTLTIHEPIQVPNAVLQPGTYVMKLLNSASDRNIVQIYNEDQTELITMFRAIPNYRITVTDKSAFLFWETPPGQPRAMRAWFWPADNFGQEFAYPKTEAVAIAATAKTDVPSTEAKAEPELKSAEVVDITPQGTEKPVEETKPVEVAQAAPPPAPEPAPAAEPAAAPEAKLPDTASPYPLIGLAGLLFLAGFAGMRLIRAR